MTTKKRWFPQFTTNNPLNRTKSDPDISWSNSDSDEEVPRKKPKFSQKSISTEIKSSNWIKIISPPHLNDNKCIDLDETSQECYLTTNEENPQKSPIIHETMIRQLSPILTQIAFRQKSPVISGREILQRIKSLHQNNEDNNVANIKDIDDNSFSSVEICPTQSAISPIKSQLSQPLNDLTIDIVSTQECSPVVIDSTSTSSTTSASESQLTQPSPQYAVRKKRFKKGGLGEQLMKAINHQKTDYNIWQHELYLNQSENKKIELFDDGKIDFHIIKCWLEYNLSIYECEEITVNSDLKNRFLLIVSSSMKSNFSFDIDRRFSMFPPYHWKSVSYRNCDVKCYFNCVKFLKH